MHLSAMRRTTATGLVDGVLYAVIRCQADGSRGTDAARRIVEGFLARVPEPIRSHLAVGVGSAVGNLEQVPYSRRQADDIVRVLRARSVAGMAELREVHLDLML